MEEISSSMLRLDQQPAGGDNINGPWRAWKTTWKNCACRMG